MQSERWPKYYCVACGSAVKALRNQCKGNKALGKYLRDLAVNDIDEYRSKVRACRLVEPSMPDGTPGLRSLRDRRQVMAQTRDSVAISVQVSDQSRVQWPNRAEYGSLKFQSGDAATKEEGMNMFDIAITEPGAIVVNDCGIQRIAFSCIPETIGARSKSITRSIQIKAGIESQGALENAKAKMSFGAMGISLTDKSFSDISSGVFQAAASGSGGSSLGTCNISRPDVGIDSAAVTVDTLKQSALMFSVDAVNAAGSAQKESTIAATDIAGLRSHVGA